MIEVRPGVVEDALAIARIHVESWQVGYRGLFDQAVLDGLSIETWYAIWLERLRDSQRETKDLVAELDGVVRGFLCLGPVGPEVGEPISQEIMALYVDPSTWGAGVGSALMTQALGEIDLMGARSTVRLLAGNDRARRLYERFGFHGDGQTRSDLVRGREVEVVILSR